MRQTCDDPVGVLVAKLQRVLADDLARFVVTGGGQGLVVEAAPRKRKHVHAAAVQEQHAVGRNGAAQDHVADAEVAFVDAYQVAIGHLAGPGGRDETVDPPLLVAVDHDGVDAAGCLLPDQPQGHVELRLGEVGIGREAVDVGREDISSQTGYDALIEPPIPLTTVFSRSRSNSRTRSCFW
jgi:hypothetical protein